MRVLLSVIVAFALFASVAVATETFSEAVAAQEAAVGCKPQCRWQCDDPVCPAKCHPVCERPKCQVHCEELESAKCKVHCDKPKCNVRCPKDLCAKESCPKCETVCAPSVCHTSCVAPEPKCAPLCEETKCDWKCKKPTLCPRPKCELVCDKPACEAKPVAAPKLACCSCSEENIAASVKSANANTASSAAKPSFMEIMHEIKHSEQAGKAGCCACAKKN